MTNQARQLELIEPKAGELTPMGMIERAVSSGASIEIIEKLMGLQERWEATQARKAFDNAVADAKAEIKPVLKTSVGHNTKYADFASIASAVDPIITSKGLSYRFRAKQEEGRIHVTCVLSHRDGHSEQTELQGPADKTGAKNEIQAIGSTLSYLQRYSLVLALGLATAKDDDGKAAGAGQKISADDAQNLRDMLKAKNASEAKFLKWARVEKLEDIPAETYESCVEAIKSFKKADAQ